MHGCAPVNIGRVNLNTAFSSIPGTRILHGARNVARPW